MKIILVIFVLYLLNGCIYEVPLKYNDRVVVDDTIVGSWTVGDTENHTVNIAKFSDNEYMVSYTKKYDTFYFRGYLLFIEGHNLMELQLISVNKRPVQNNRRKYVFYKYVFEGNKIKVFPVNTKVISKNIKSSREMSRIFNKNINNHALYIESGYLVRSR